MCVCVCFKRLKHKIFLFKRKRNVFFQIVPECNSLNERLAAERLCGRVCVSLTDESVIIIQFGSNIQIVQGLSQDLLCVFIQYDPK